MGGGGPGRSLGSGSLLGAFATAPAIGETDGVCSLLVSRASLFFKKGIFHLASLF